MLNTFETNAEDGALCHISKRLPPEVTEKLIDMLLTCMAKSQLVVALYDPSDRLQFANPSFRSAYAIGPAAYPTWEEMFRNCYISRTGVLVETDDIDVWFADIAMRRRHSINRTFEVDLIDGRWLRMTESMSSDGWLLCVASDITSLKTNERLLEQARDSAVYEAQTDSLTGSYNRRFIFSRLDEILDHARITRTPLSVAVLDLDHFKHINDTYGHSAGDQILKLFVTEIQGKLRPCDLLGRIGGEEFLLLLPNTPLAEAVQIIERLRCETTKKIILLERPEARCTFSAGVTDVGWTDTVSSAFQRADQAVYAAKRGGRDRQAAISS